MQRRLFLVSLASGLSMIAACAPVPGELALAPNSTLIVVRHGDRDGENLSDKGRTRARALVEAVQDFDLAGIYAPGIQRNLDTAAPLSEAREMPIRRIPQEKPTPRLVAQGAGKAVIWVGNKGNIRQIWEDLRLADPAPLEYGDLFIVRSDATGAVTVERRFFGPE